MTEAIKSTLPYVFENMGIRRIETTVNVHNFRSVKVLIRLGFQIEGVLREYGHLNGKACDVITFSLLKRDWQAGVRAKDWGKRLC